MSMYKISTAVAIERVTDETKDALIQELKDGRIDRVFLCGAGGFMYGNDCFYINEPEKSKEIIKLFKDNGFEVGIWMSTLGHGCMLSE